MSGRAAKLFRRLGGLCGVPPKEFARAAKGKPQKTKGAAYKRMAGAAGELEERRRARVAEAAFDAALKEAIKGL